MKIKNIIVAAIFAFAALGFSGCGQQNGAAKEDTTALRGNPDSPEAQIAAEKGKAQMARDQETAKAAARATAPK